jgi:transcriptional regulator with XRE-family HTH domain
MSISSHFMAVTYGMAQVRETRRALSGLGLRLRRARLERNDSMAVFAQRIGASVQTLRAMERGLPSVQVGTWLEALWVLNELEALDHLLERRESVLDLAPACLQA